MEAGAQAGGKLASVQDSGFLLERAAIGVLDRRGDFAALCARLGLEPLPASPAAGGRFVERNGRVYKLRSPFSLFGGPLLSAGEKLALLGEPWRSRAAALEADESLASFFRRRLGRAGSFAADLLQTGIYAGDAEALEAQACFPELSRWEREQGSLARGAFVSRRLARRAARAGPRAALPERAGGPSSGLVRTPSPGRPRLASFAQGMGELPAAMARALGETLRLGCQVRSLRREGGGFIVSIADSGSTRELACRALVLALPGPQLASLCAPLDAQLGSALGQLTAAPIAQVHLGVRESDLRSPLQPQRGFGLLSPARPAIGTLFPSALWPGRAPEGHVLISVLVGGAKFPESAALPEADLLSLVRDELARTIGLPLDAQPALARTWRWPLAVPQYLRGHTARIAAIDARAATLPGLQLAGSWLRGVSVLDCLHSGQQAAAAAASFVSC